MYDFKPQETGELELHRGDIITVVNRSDKNWWKGKVGAQKGIFPATYVVPYTRWRGLNELWSFESATELSEQPSDEENHHQLRGYWTEKVVKIFLSFVYFHCLLIYTSGKPNVTYKGALLEKLFVARRASPINWYF